MADDDTTGTAAGGGRPSRVLEGLRVFEVSIAVAAPSCGRFLAYHGAEVIKVESKHNPDVARAFGSAWARKPELADVFCDTSPYVAEMSGGKLSLGLEMKEPGALEAAYRLLATCDVFLSNYAAPAMAELGLSYDAVREHQPNIIYAGMTGFGVNPDAPYYNFRAYGPNQAPLVGLDDLTGYPDQPPAGITSIAPPDYIGGLHASIAVLSALAQRDATGQGCFIDISQLETTVSLLGPWLTGHDLGAPPLVRDGNRLGWAAPCGTYPCAGDDRWVAISVTDDTAWQRLRALAGLDAVGDGFADCDTLARRRERHDEIDRAIAAWTTHRSAHEAAATLAGHGVAAYPVHDHAGVAGDEHVRDRGYFEVRPSTRMGRDLMSGHPIRMSDTPARLERAGPNMGEHTREVLGSLGYDDAAIDEMISSGAAFTDAQPELTLERPFDSWYETMGIGS